MIRLDYPSFRKAFHNHRSNAKFRGIGFELAFEHWLKIWLDSGHLAERGNKRGQYCMARFGDKGPYAVGNVKIITMEENRSEQVVSDVQRAEHSQWMMGNQNVAEYARSDEGRAAMSQRSIGKQYGLGSTRSDEWCAEQSQRMLGKKNALGRTWEHSDETCANMREAQQLRRERERKEKESK